MENVLTAVSLVVFIPLLGMLINLFFGKYFSETGAGLVASMASGGAFLVSVLLAFGLAANDYQPMVVEPLLLDAWIRIPSANVDIPWQFRVDTLSVTMMLVVSGVGTLIHIYAIGYMHGDSRFSRFFVYLNLFLVFMMILVTGNNLLMMFVGWEGVGLCSFLLIGFWYDKTHRDENGVSLGWKNSNAARKAFIANRVGDFGVVLAVLLSFWTFGTLDFYKVGEAPSAGYGGGHAQTVKGWALADDDAMLHLSEMGIFNQAEILVKQDGYRVNFGGLDLPFMTVLTLITLCMLLGAAGKSAQIPLFVWLPDAMAGPTPVSALIHAATMVTAGVYMMVRANSFFYHAELSSFIVTMIGIATALMAGFIAMGQWDVKRVLAYSTVSQLGFMVAAVGLGAYAAAMFHLVTHAVFKALLFLGSGSIIHGMEHGHHHLHEHSHGHDDHGHDGHHDEAHDVHHSPSHDSDHEEEFDPQDMRTMGGLRHKMPITYITYLIGTLALAGIFPFAGFWSKDEILVDAWVVGWENGEVKGFMALFVLLAAAGFTAFYMWRQVSLVFFGEPRHEAAEHASESTRLMTIPLIILAVGSLLIGFINVPSGVPLLGRLFGEHRFTDWVTHSVVHAHSANFIWWLALGATLLAVGAIFAASTLYTRESMRGVRVKDPLQRLPQTGGAFGLANARLYWDETYFRFIENPYNRISAWLADKLDWAFWHDFVHERVIFGSYRSASQSINQNVDRGLIDGGINFAAVRGVSWLAGRIRLSQTGYVKTYAFSVVLGTVIILIVILLPVLRDLLGVYGTGQRKRLLELETTGVSLTSVLLFAPLVGLIPLAFMKDERMIRVATLVTTLITFGLSVLMLAGFESGVAGYQFQHIQEWIPSIGITYHVGVDGITIWLIMLTTFIMPIAVLASWTSITDRLKLFHMFLLILEFAMLGVFVSLDLFLFYIFWEISLVPMYFMIGMWGSKDKVAFFGRQIEARIYAAVKFFIYTVSGSILMLLAILWLGNQADTFNVPMISEMLRSGAVGLSTDTERLLFLGFFIAFAIKVPLWPLHSWLPDAHVQAPTAGSIILAGVLLKLGTYGIIRYNLDFFPNASMDFAPFIATLAVIGIIYGAWVSYAQKDVKKLVAYSSVSHLGFVVLGIFALNSAGVSGALIQMVNHGISTGALFLLVGMLYERRHTKAMNAFGGLWKVMPIFGGFALVISLSSMGLPGLNGFVGEFTILLGSAGSEHLSLWFTVLATLGIIMAAVYMLYMFNNVFMGPVDKAENQELKDLTWGRNWYELSALIAFTVLIFVIGLYPAPFFDLMDSSVSNLVRAFGQTAVEIAGR